MRSSLGLGDLIVRLGMQDVTPSESSAGVGPASLETCGLSSPPDPSWLIPRQAGMQEHIAEQWHREPRLLVHPLQPPWLQQIACCGCEQGRSSSQRCRCSYLPCCSLLLLLSLRHSQFVSARGLFPRVTRSPGVFWGAPANELGLGQDVGQLQVRGSGVQGSLALC